METKLLAQQDKDTAIKQLAYYVLRLTPFVLNMLNMHQSTLNRRAMATSATFLLH